jgi:hypothetical protein
MFLRNETEFLEKRAQWLSLSNYYSVFLWLISIGIYRLRIRY